MKQDEDIKKRFLKRIVTYASDEKYCLTCWDELLLQYTANSRHYHTLEHLANMFVELDKVSNEVEDLDSLEFSIFYHDIIYNPVKSDNEYQSALLFEKRISRTSFSGVSRVMNQIEATQKHLLSKDHDTNILLDIDLSILGSSSDAYAKYCNQIRKEYAIYPDFMYRKGRKKVIRSFLDLETIFKTAFFRNEYEVQARENLQKELVDLG